MSRSIDFVSFEKTASLHLTDTLILIDMRYKQRKTMSSVFPKIFT